jgi:aspartate kinase
MTCIVQKFGGTSVATLDLIKKAALRIKSEVDAGHQVVAVVSAMAGTTNSLVSSIRDLSTTYDRAEYDAIVSSGEQVTAGLLALALQNIGLPARSWLGWQIPIHTSTQYAGAQIKRIETDALLADLKKGCVAVVAGFQGLSPEGRVTTLGRGGSDTTAVALAAALKADRCDIFTDVDGVYTADPRYVSAADKLNHIAYQEMLELAAQGAKVLQKESVEYAMKHQVRLRVLSSLSEVPGTLITHEKEAKVRHSPIRGLAHSLNEELFTLTNLPQNPALIDQIRALLESHHILIDMIQQNLSLCGRTLNFSFTLPETEADRASTILHESKDGLQFNDLLRDSGVAKISVIGTGLLTQHSPSNKLFQVLREEKIDVHTVLSSDIKLSVLIPAQHAERAIASLHTMYQLDAEEKERVWQQNI